MSSFIFIQVENFLLKFCPFSNPLLLALSGGPDSLCLFYALLFFRERYGRSFHVAHVDHKWRKESKEEAHALQQLALHYQVPFHLKVLEPLSNKRNLEGQCREKRYAFFAQLYHKFSLQGVLTGHHQDDQAETIFKRLLEGAHWSRWIGLQSENWIKGARILRPLLHIAKSEIQKLLSEKQIKAFEDPSNRHVQFLRARLREVIFPRLNQEFGKKIQNNLIVAAKDAQELIDYFDARLEPLLKTLVKGPWGIYLDLQSLMPTNLLEVKYLLRLLCRKSGFSPSRDIIERAAQALQLGKANQLFERGSNQIWIDRQRVFIMAAPFIAKESQTLQICLGNHLLNGWKLKVSEGIYHPTYQISSWKEGWAGQLKVYIPRGNYKLGFKKVLSNEMSNAIAIKKRWSQAKVPAFLYSYFPVIWEEKKIYHEFLTGKPLLILSEKAPCWEVALSYSS